LINADHAIRIARPSLDLAAAERFYADGPGLKVLFKKDGKAANEPHDLLMVGPDGGQWHLDSGSPARTALPDDQRGLGGTRLDDCQRKFTSAGMPGR
jgi:catechol 2,3-dioxygenase-like lactoylglutathione lyase family enzyme